MVFDRAGLDAQFWEYTSLHKELCDMIGYTFLKMFTKHCYQATRFVGLNNNKLLDQEISYANLATVTLRISLVCQLQE